jgi:hypothetical protein
LGKITNGLTHRYLFVKIADGPLLSSGLKGNGGAAVPGWLHGVIAKPVKDDQTRAL